MIFSSFTVNCITCYHNYDSARLRAGSKMRREKQARYSTWGKLRARAAKPPGERGLQTASEKKSHTAIVTLFDS